MAPSEPNSVKQVLLLLIRCLLLLRYVVGPCFVFQYFISFLCCNHIYGEERGGFFTLIVFLMSCDYFTLVNVYVDLVVFTRITGTS